MALTQSPTYPTAGTAVSVASDASAVLLFDYAIELTSVPPASSLSTGLQLKQATSTTADPIEAAKAGLLADGFTPDVAGEYGVTVYVIQQRPLPGEIRYAISATDSGTVNVGQVAQLPILTERYGGATLQITIVDDTIRAASLVEFVDEASRAAAQQTTVTAALTAMVGVTVATAIGDPYTRANDLRTNFNAHLANTTVHAVADATNPIEGEAVYSLAGLLRFLATMLEAANGHALDADAASRWHEEEDTSSLPAIGTATDLGGATVLLSDLRERFYERHRVLGDASTPAVHRTTAADTTNTLSAPTVLDDLVVAYLDALVDEAPTPATGEVDGAVLAAATGGFRLIA